MIRSRCKEKWVTALKKNVPDPFPSLYVHCLQCTYEELPSQTISLSISQNSTERTLSASVDFHLANIYHQLTSYVHASPTEKNRSNITTGYVSHLLSWSPSIMPKVVVALNPQNLSSHPKQKCGSLHTSLMKRFGTTEAMRDSVGSGPA